MLALIAAMLGFGGVAVISVEIARILFFIFIILLVISLVVPRMRGPGAL